MSTTLMHPLGSRYSSTVVVLRLYGGDVVVAKVAALGTIISLAKTWVGRLRREKVLQ